MSTETQEILGWIPIGLSLVSALTFFVFVAWGLFLTRVVKITGEKPITKEISLRIVFLPLVALVSICIVVIVSGYFLAKSISLSVAVVALVVGALSISLAGAKTLAEQILQHLAKLSVRWILIFANQSTRDLFEWHVRWRFELAALKTFRWWERLEIWRELKMMRWLWVLLAGAVTYAMAAWLITGHLWQIPSKADINNLGATNAGVWTLVTALVSAPVAFVIWLFRDANNTSQIDNARKDTNLKDFQQLAQWASGMHIEERSYSRSEKAIYDNAVILISKELTETTSSSTARTKYESELPAISKYDGAASLQVAAVYQLHAFLRGDFGKHFQRPAFALFRSIWLALVAKKVQENLKKWNTNWTKFNNSDELCDWRTEFHQIVDTPLAKAITLAIADVHGLALQAHTEDLPVANFDCMNFELAGIQTPLELFQHNLQGIQLIGAKLGGAQLQGACLQFANLSGTNLQGANLQGASLQESTLLGAELRAANLQGAEMTMAKLQASNLASANLQGANLMGASLQGAFLGNVNLQGADLRGANLHGTYLGNANLQGAVMPAGWQLDPQAPPRIMPDGRNA